MPKLNNFEAHIYLLKAFATEEKIIESRPVSHREKKTVTCNIPVSDNAIFKIRYWYNGRNRDAFAYTAAFFLDGMKIAHSLCSREFAQAEAGECKGYSDGKGEPSLLRFRPFAATGDEDTSEQVPEDIGRLELVIRRANTREDDQGGGNTDSEDESRDDDAFKD